MVVPSGIAALFRGGPNTIREQQAVQQVRGSVILTTNESYAKAEMSTREPTLA